MAALFYLPSRPAFSPNGLIAPGAKLFFYATGTLTPQTVYSDAAMTKPLPNPVEANAAGLWAPIYLNDTLIYRLRIDYGNGSPLDEFDPYLPGLAERGNDGPEGPQGQPGGNIMSVGPFSGLSAIAVLAGTTLIQSSDATRGVLIEDATLTDADVAAHPRAIVKTANGRFFRRDPRNLWVEQFGAVGDRVTSDWAAIQAALAYASFCGVSGPFRRTAVPLRFGIGNFMVNERLDLSARHTLIGMGGGMENGEIGTTITQTAGRHIFIVNRYDTVEGAFVAGRGPEHSGADGTEFAGINFVYDRVEDASFRGPGGPRAISSRARINVHDCTFQGFAGPGILIEANVDTTGSTHGEASAASIRRCAFLRCWKGLRASGGDANVLEVTSCTFGSNDTFGLDANQFLSSTFTNLHFKDNGRKFTVAYQGSRYALMPDQEARGGQVAPGTDPSVWSYIDDFTGDGRFWASGGSYTPGGAVRHTGRSARSVFVGCYTEGGEGLPVIMFPAISLGGQWSHAAGADGVHYMGEQGVATARGFRAMRAGQVNEVFADPETGVSVGALAISDRLFMGPRGSGFRIGIGLGDATSSVTVQGVTDPNPGYMNLLRTRIGNTYADNAAAKAAGLSNGALFLTPDGIARGVV